MLTLAAIVVIAALALYGFLKHEDVHFLWMAGLACVLTGLSWHLASQKTLELDNELREARDEIAALEVVPETRGFTAEARAELVSELSKFVGPTAYVLSNASDAETAEYAREIAAILKEAGWNVPPSFGMSYNPVVLPGQDGLQPGLVIGTAGVPDEFVNAVIAVFRDYGVDISRGPHWPGTEHPISILVGPRRSRGAP